MLHYPSRMSGISETEDDSGQSAEKVAFPSRDDAEHIILDRALRSEIAHELSSPVRGVAILSDLFGESLNHEELDQDLLKEISRQFDNLAADLSQRLADFTPKDDI